MYKTLTTALRARKYIPPLWWLAPPPFPVGSMSLDSRVAGLPYESSSFATPPPQFGGVAKESALMGRLGALLRSTVEVLCRTSTVAL